MQDNNQSLQALSDAMDLIKAGAFLEAEQIAASLSSQSNAVTHEIRFHIALAQGTWGLAKQHIEILEKLCGARSELWLALGHSTYAAGAWAETIAASDSLIARAPAHPNWAKAILMREIAALNAGHPHRSPEDLESAADAIIQESEEVTDRDSFNSLIFLFYLCVGLIGSRDRASQAYAYLQLQYAGADLEPREAAVATGISTQSWCQENGALFRILVEPYPVTMADQNGVPNSHEYINEEIALASIPGGQVIAGWDFIITPDERFLKDSCLQVRSSPKFLRHFYLREINRVIYPSGGEAEYIDEEALFLSAPADNHFGHWISDYLPRLLALQHLGSRNVKVFAPKGLPSKFKEMLLRFGVDDSKMIFGEYGKRYKFRELHFLKFHNDPRAHPLLMGFIRQGLKPSQCDQTDKKLRIFCERDSDKRRQISNWPEVTSLFEEYGITSICLSKLSYTDQCALLSRAEIIVGVTGSSLHAMFSVPDGCYVVELQIWREYNYWYDIVTRTIGLKHISSPCRPLPEEAGIKSSLYTSVIVDCGALRTRLETITAEMNKRS